MIKFLSFSTGNKGVYII